MTHREAIKEYLGNIILGDDVVFDWGSGSKPVQRYLGGYGECKFITIDKNPLIAEDRKSANHISMDITTPAKFSDIGDVAFCIEVLEHTEKPFDVLINIRDNLKDGSNFYLSVPFMFRIHDDADYWRWTRQGIELMLKQAGFRNIEVQETVNQEGYIAKCQK